MQNGKKDFIEIFVITAEYLDYRKAEQNLLDCIMQIKFFLKFGRLSTMTKSIVRVGCYD